MILVTGATGNVGGALAGAGQPARALVRAGREPGFPAGVQPVTGDLNQPESMRPALAGPQALLPVGRARVLGEVLGRDLRFEAQPDDEARAEMGAAMPAAYVDAFFDFYVKGTLDESQPQPDVEEVTGRPPRSFRQWAQAHASEF